MEFSIFNFEFSIFSFYQSGEVGGVVVEGVGVASEEELEDGEECGDADEAEFGVGGSEGGEGDGGCGEREEEPGDEVDGA